MVCQNTDLFREYTSPEGFSFQTPKKNKKSRATGKRKAKETAALLNLGLFLHLFT